MKRRERRYSGSLSPAVTERELKNRAMARMAASEGFVLLKTEQILPFADTEKVFLAGDGAIHPIKGGTGSGDVNEREVVDILTGLLDANIEVVNQAAVEAAIQDYEMARQEYADTVIQRLNEDTTVGSDMVFDVVYGVSMRPYQKIEIEEASVKEASLVLYMVSRVAGEGADRTLREGDYELSAEEKADIQRLSVLTDRIVVLINTGGQIDVKELLSCKSVKAILYISQAGMEMGHAAADVLTGKVTPSGKLTNTWAVNYSDIPGAENFSHNNGDLEKELYEDGIYVGYRFFDSFGVKPAFPFGFGLSYTQFSVSEEKVSVNGDEVEVSAKVTNCGDTFSGKEVLQVYAACPQKETKKEFKKLLGYAKTMLLAPGESQVLSVKVSSKHFACYSYEKAAWIVEAGEYALFTGNSSSAVSVCGILQVKEDVVVENVGHILPLQRELAEIERPDEIIEELTQKWKKDALEKGIDTIDYCPAYEKTEKYPPAVCAQYAREVADKLSDEEIAAFLLGEITKGQDNVHENVLVETGIYVPGAAGETTCKFEEKYDIPGISMADGPAGIRLMRSYDVDKVSGKIYGSGLLSALEGGLFAPKYSRENVDTYYMYATAIPVGTCLAQSFNTELVKEIGQMVAGEMQEFGVSWWLAPGMNIHRNPLCGRNFEYYSEDPVVAGTMAAAITLGVQSMPGVGTTIKHFACNNQEDNRMHVDAVVSERALREIYLRGFEIAVKTSQPMCIMTSYNVINGIHTANSYDLCTQVVREEWGFQGVIMTDWTTTTAGGSKAHVCALAGNDLIMPGDPRDVEDILKALSDGSLPRQTARACVERLIRVILQTNGMEDCVPYKEQFGF